MRAVYRNEIVFSVLVDPHCNWTSQLCVIPSIERITCAGPSKSSASSSKRKSGPSCETCTFEPSRTTCIFTSAEWPPRLSVMDEVRDSLAQRYPLRRKIKLGERLGFGIHGTVFSAVDNTKPGFFAVKFHR